MHNDCGNPEASSSGRFLETVRPLRDFESNWTVDLAKNLEEYLLKICSGDEYSVFSVNFAEAALLLQGSVQVYSRKVEYLYSLVLHALHFISQKSQDDEAAGESPQGGASGTHAAKTEQDDPFWGLDDISVDAKNSLDNASSRAPLPSHYVRPPANLVVLEGECLDAGGDAGELESYLLATTDVYRDFILLDTCDAVCVDYFLDSKSGKGLHNIYRGSGSVASKGQKSFQSPSRYSGQKLSAKKRQDTTIFGSPRVDHGVEFDGNTIGCSSPNDFPADRNDEFEMGCGYSGPADLDDSDDGEDDPWKPLNPHEPGNLRVKPYKRVKANKRVEFNSRKCPSLAVEFPLAKLHGPVSTELTDIWEAEFGALGKAGNSETPSLYEKLRQTLVEGDRRANDAFSSPENNSEEEDDDDEYDGGDQAFGPPNFDMPDYTFNNDVPLEQDKHEQPEAHANLEDLCKSHLDALLATLAENEKQTELTTRVSTWKQRIEKNLEEQDAHPPFDIHKYGEKVLDKLSAQANVENNCLPFGDVVRGQEKHDIARTFSALLQLVNNGDVDLVTNNTSDQTPTCYSEANPFYIRSIRNEKNLGARTQPQPSKKRPKSPLLKGHPKLERNKGKENLPVSPQSSSWRCRFSVTLGKASNGGSTPETKKRRKSRITAE